MPLLLSLALSFKPPEVSASAASKGVVPHFVALTRSVPSMLGRHEIVDVLSSFSSQPAERSG